MDAVVLFDPINSGDPLKQAASDLGYKVIGIFSCPKSVYETQFHLNEEMLRRNCDQILFSNDIEEILKQLKNSPFSVRASIAGIDSGVNLADQVGHALGLPGNRFDLSSARRDKGRMREVLKEKGFSCPDFSICDTQEKILRFVRGHSFPLVIKTPRGAGTSHVYVCDKQEQVLAGFRAIQREKNFFGEKTGSAVIESFIGGNEYVIDTFSDGERAHVTDIWVYEKIQTETFKNIYYSVISLPLTAPETTPMQKTAVRIAEAFGVKLGPAHLELKDDPIRGPTLIELGPRLAGARLPQYLRKYSNFDPYRSTIEVFVKGKISLPHPIILRKQIAVAFCPLFQKGTIAKISGIEAIQKLNSYETHQLYIKVGDSIEPTTDLATSPLFVFLAHEDRRELLLRSRCDPSPFQVVCAP